MTCRERLEELFQKRKVGFDVVEHAKAAGAQRVARASGLPGRQIAKVVMVVADGDWAMMVLPATYKLSTKKAQKVLRARRVRIAAEEEFADLFPDCDTGAMPPFGDLYDLPLYVDHSLMNIPEIAFTAGVHGETMRISFADYERVAKPTIANFGDK